MNYIDRKAAKEIVKKALLEVADFNGEFEDFKFEKFQNFHIKVFLNSIKTLVNRTPCSDANGNITDKEYFDINLSVTLFNTWKKVNECIDYIVNSHSRGKSNTSKIQLP